MGSNAKTLEGTYLPGKAIQKAARRRKLLNQRRLHRFLYLFTDFLVSFGVWLVFVIIRRKWFGEEPFRDFELQFINATVIAIYWWIVYAIAGLYSKPLRKSRVQELTQILKYTAIGVLIIFFAILLDDQVDQNSRYRFTVTTFFGLQFCGIALTRFLITTRTQIRIRSRKLGFPTLIVGCGPHAFNIYQELENMRRSLGYQIKGFVDVKNCGENLFYGKLKRFGNTDALFGAILSRNIEEVIIALEPDDADQIGKVIDICSQTNAYIKMAPSAYDFIVGTVKVSHILGAPLIEVSPQIMKPWEVVAKRAFDVFFSLIAFTLMIPVYAIVSVLIKIDSKGPVLYKQERIGKGGKPFFIYKFRSMFVDAEKAGPALSSKDDPRITRVGKVMRKLRIDELPQFWNVLIGDMSIVGPRPERAHFIKEIVKKAPHYRHLHKVKPGITSWGQVKYGYAENVDEMVRRLKFDILYLENMSFVLDLRIILYTIIVMLEGRGK